MSEEQDPRDVPRHPIRVVSERTGLTPDVLRVWQKRYGVVAPGRTARGQRLYSDAELERLGLLADAVRGGRSIGSIAELGRDELAALVAEDVDARRSQARTYPPGAADELVEAGLAAVAALDASELERVLRRSLVQMSVPRFLEEVASPLFGRIGAGWSRGELTPAHEHAASAVMRRVLEWVIAACEPEPDAPAMVVTTPPGEQHEIGALMVATTAATEGWKVTYLGANLPVHDTAAAVHQAGAGYVAVSAVFTSNATELLLSVQHLRSVLPAEVVLIAGGSAIEALPKRALTKQGTVVLRDAGELRRFMREQSQLRQAV